MTRVVVVGAGVTGLTAAWALRRARPELDVVVLESRSRAGGNVISVREGGFLIDGGPDAFIRTKPDAVQLCRELGIADTLAAPRPESRRVYVVRRGRLRELPVGMSLAVPTRLGPLFGTPLVSWRGKLEAALEPLRPAGRELAEDESIEDFFARRVGRDLARDVAGPLLAGIYAGNPRELSLRATFPQLLELEARHGSLTLGLLRAARARAGGPQLPPRGGFAARLDGALQLVRAPAPPPEPESPFLAPRLGMGRLVEALTRELPAGALRLGAPVRSVRVTGRPARLEVLLDGGARLDARHVVLACPAHAASTMVPDERLARELGGIEYASTATVFFALDRAQVAHPLDASGFIASERESALLAATWVSTKWEGRAPAGSVLLRAFVGGRRDPRRVETSTDEELARFARRELERLMGSLGQPRFMRVFRWERANPQPVVGHLARLQRVAARVAEVPGLHLAGAAYDGVGIPDCIRQARAAASRILAEP